MRANFDGARIRLARCFNQLAQTKLTSDQLSEMEELRDIVGGFLCMYDDGSKDCNDLSEKVALVELPERVEK